MSYEPTEWKAGDTVTSAKLNKIENGFSIVAPLIIEATYEDELLSLTTSVTYNDVMAALNQGKIVILHMAEDQYHHIFYLYETAQYDDEYYVSFLSNSRYMELIASSANDLLELNIGSQNAPESGTPIVSA